MGGDDEPENLIELSPEDHFNAHLILAHCFQPKQREYRGNLSSCQMICRGIRKYIKKIYGVDYKTPDYIFWETAGKLLSEQIRGENHPSYGREYTEEERIQISKRMAGSGNPFYGKKHTDDARKKIGEKNKGRFGDNHPLKGKKKSDETKRKLSIAQSKIQAEKPIIELPDGVYYCNEVIDGKKKSCYRFCPECNKQLFHLLRADAVRFHKKRLPCFECAMKKRRNCDKILP
jgi:hypothetical protein